jgi:hypothetical protein
VLLEQKLARCKRKKERMQHAMEGVGQNDDFISFLNASAHMIEELSF